MKDITLIRERDLLCLMSGQKYPVTMILKSRTIKCYDGEDLYHVTAKHAKHGLFKIDCRRDEIEDKSSGSLDNNNKG